MRTRYNENYIMLYNYEDRYCTQVLKTLERPHHFTKRGGLSPKSYLIPPLLIAVPVPSQESEQTCICS